MIKVTPDEFKTIAKYIYQISGISLGLEKAYLLETRLNDLLVELECASFSEFYYKVKSNHSQDLNRKVIDAITTNETLFFRDMNPFEVLKNKIIPDIVDRKSLAGKGATKIPIRIWSAACSTGQEAYSIAITAKKTLKNLDAYDLKIVGTDLSESVLEKATRGEYSAFEVGRGLDNDALNTYFTQKGSNWVIKDEFKKMVTFKKLNLFDNLSQLGTFDIIFCRNVAIYFTIEDRRLLFGKIENVLDDFGSLIIGASEYLTGISDKYTPQRHLRSVFYQKTGVKVPAMA